jgi:hypothetical protein
MNSCYYTNRLKATRKGGNMCTEAYYIQGSLECEHEDAIKMASHFYEGVLEAIYETKDIKQLYNCLEELAYWVNAKPPEKEIEWIAM